MQIVFLFILICNYGIIQAQNNTQIPEDDKHIATFYFEYENKNLNGIPMLPLNSPFKIHFDELTGEESYYYYQIKHYDKNWQETLLSKNQFLIGNDNHLINDNTASNNTLQTFTHYTINIPNTFHRGFKRSGNYSIDIYNDWEELVVSKKFIIYEAESSIKIKTKRTRDLKFIDTHQRIELEITPEEIIINPKENLHVIILQNNNLKTAKHLQKPQFVIGNTFVYNKEKEMSFAGGNEYLNFDNKDLRTGTTNIAKTQLKEIFHHYLFAHQKRKFLTYTYNPDINGGFLINQYNRYKNIDSNSNAEYVWVHFKLMTNKYEDQNVHVYGGFNNYNLNKTTQLKYNYKEQAYMGKLLLKQGFYNFNYVSSNVENTKIIENLSGNFFQTENEYTILVYYKSPDDIAERIIGWSKGYSINVSR